MMTTKSSAMLMLYSMTLLVFQTKTSLFMYWIMLELNMILFIMMMFSMSEKMNMKMSVHNSFFYFIIQSIGSSLFLMSSLLATKESMLGVDVIFCVSLMLKMGMFPFQQWVFLMAPFMSGSLLGIMLTLQKFPLMMIFINFQQEMIVLLSLMSGIGGVILMWGSKTLKDLIISSSIYMMIWIFCMMNLSMSMFVAMYMLYTSMVIEMLNEGKKKNISMSSGSNLMKMKSLALMSFFLGVPPLSLFMMKLNVITTNMISMTSMLSLLWMLTVASLMAYLKFFWMNLDKGNMSYMMASSDGKFAEKIKLIFFMLISMALIT